MAAELRIDSTNNTNTGSLRFGDTSDNYIGAVEYNHRTNVLSLYADNATRMSVSSTGIDVTGSVTADGLNVEIADNAASPVTMQQGGNSYFKIVTTNTSESVQLGNTTTNPDILLGGGSVGIGTSNPSSYYANHLVVNTGSSAQSGITIVSDTNRDGMFAFADGTSGDARYRGYINYNHVDDSMVFGSAESTRLTLDSNGNVGIGKTAGAVRIDVETDQNGNLAGQFKNTHATGSYGIKVMGGHDATNYSAVFTDKDNNTLMYIRGDGRVGIGTTTPANPLVVKDGTNVDMGFFQKQMALGYRVTTERPLRMVT